MLSGPTTARRKLRSITSRSLASVSTSPFSCKATVYLTNGGALEHAQEMAAHESPRTIKLYDRTRERLTQAEVERFSL